MRRRTSNQPSLHVLVLATLVLSGGCSHTWFQYQVSQNELDAIENTKNALAATQSNPNGLLQVVDLDGRRAVETLIAGMTVEQTDADPQFQQLSRALFLAVMGDSGDPFTALDQDAAFMAARFAQSVASRGLSAMGLGGLAAMVGIGGDDTPERLREMQGSLARGRIQTCAQGDVVVSYDAGILGHIHSQIAEQDPVYRAWRDRVRAIHLVRFTCQSGHVLMIQTRNANEAGLRAIGWHFLTPQQWQAMEPRLRQAFDLP